jgi:hypothetical protein
MAARPKTKTPESPEEDEWGFYDPEQAGLPAVLGRLEAKSKESAASYAARIARTLRGNSRAAAPAAPARPIPIIKPAK